MHFRRDINGICENCFREIIKILHLENLALCSIHVYVHDLSSEPPYMGISISELS